MYRKIVVFSVLLLVMFVLGSCTRKQDVFDRNNDLSAELNIAKEKLALLQDSLAVLKQQNWQIISDAQGVFDSLTAENQVLLAENVEFKAQLVQTRAEIPVMRQRYESLVATQQKIIDDQAEEIKCLEFENWTLSNDNENLRGDNASLKTELDNLKPWAGKWRHDSQRSFIKVMLGAGKAPVPDVPTPQLE